MEEMIRQAQEQGLIEFKSVPIWLFSTGPYRMDWLALEDYLWERN